MSGSLRRIKEYIDFKGINVSMFERSVNISNGAFASQLKKDKTIGVDKLENILLVYPDLNADWVITGKGNMLKDIGVDGKDNQPAVVTPTIDLSVVAILQKNYERTIASLNSVIAIQEKTIAVLEQVITRK